MSKLGNSRRQKQTCFTDLVGRISENPDPYLQFLTTISSEWPQIRLLADFMEVGTDPLRWRNFHDDDKHNIYTYPDNPNDRSE